MKNMLNYVTILEESGMKKSIAESVIQVLNESMESNFATKHDLEKCQQATKIESDWGYGEFEKFRIEMRSGFEKMDLKFDHFETKMTLRLGSIAIVSMVIMIVFMTVIVKIL